MNSRATRAQVGASQPDVPDVERDFFVTHPDSVRALLEVEHLGGTIWEPAAGDGTMAAVLRTGTGVNSVICSDVVNRGCPELILKDFLSTPAIIGVDHIVTNPPYELAEEFVAKALELDPPGKVAMFLRLAFLEGKGRRERLFTVRPPARIWVFSSRQPLRRNGGPWQSGLIAFAWFVWSRDRVPFGGTRLGWLP